MNNFINITKHIPTTIKYIPVKQIKSIPIRYMSNNVNNQNKFYLMHKQFIKEKEKQLRKQEIYDINCKINTLLIRIESLEQIILQQDKKKKIFKDELVFYYFINYSFILLILYVKILITFNNNQIISNYLMNWIESYKSYESWSIFIGAIIILGILFKITGGELLFEP